MVKSDGGQLYTIEGVAAALIMLITAYMVVNATTIYTAGDTHISDMQLEQMGSDALTVMDTKENSAESTVSNLQTILQDNPPDAALFNTEFLRLMSANGINPGRDIQFYATYTCANSDETTSSNNFISSSNNDFTGTEHPVRVTKWVILTNKAVCGGPADDRAVLVEVLLWLD